MLTFILNEKTSLQWKNYIHAIKHLASIIRIPSFQIRDKFKIVLCNLRDKSIVDISWLRTSTKLTTMILLCLLLLPLALAYQ